MFDVEKLIMIVQKYTNLYNKKNIHYYDSKRRKQCWIAISKAMNSKADKCRKKWNYLRKEYRKSVRDLENGNRRSPFKFAKQMKFLKGPVSKVGQREEIDEKRLGSANHTATNTMSNRNQESFESKNYYLASSIISPSIIQQYCNWNKSSDALLGSTSFRPASSTDTIVNFSESIVVSIKEEHKNVEQPGSRDDTTVAVYNRNQESSESPSFYPASNIFSPSMFQQRCNKTSDSTRIMPAGSSGPIIDFSVSMADSTKEHDENEKRPESRDDAATVPMNNSNKPSSERQTINPLSNGISPSMRQQRGNKASGMELPSTSFEPAGSCDSIKKFFDSMADSVKALPLQLQITAKRGVLDVVSKAELAAVSGDY